MSENSNANGEAGDSTGNEVCIRNDYNILKYDFTFVLRPQNKVLAELSAKACEAACENSAVGYSQDSRNSLFSEGQKVDFAFNRITTKCNTDCSAFMTACAVAGGAKFSYYTSSGNNAPVCSTMKNWFTSTDDYVVLASEQYLKQTDYLKRGDILVYTTPTQGHTVMVLENGCAIPPATDLAINIYLKDINTTSCLFNINITQVELYTGSNVVNEEIKSNNIVANASVNNINRDITLLTFYNYSYELTNLDDNTSENSGSLSIIGENTELPLVSLKPATSYSLRVIATEKNTSTEDFCTLASARFIFRTLNELPDAIIDLNIKYDFENLPEDDFFCTLSYRAPSNWSTSALQRGYRISLIINGKILAFNDKIILNVSSNTEVHKRFSIKEILNGIKIVNFKTLLDVLNLNSTVQISVLPWIKDSRGDYFFSTLTTATKPFTLKYFMKVIDKAYIQIEDTYKQVILWNTKNGVC